MTRSISEIRKTFGENLKLLLIKNNKTIVQTCNKIGINRTQFNRYLSGASSPRPEVLRKICDYFDVDARVLLEPLSHQPSWNSSQALARQIADQIKGNNYLVDDTLLPSGFYRKWLCSHTKPGTVYTSLVLIKTDKTGVKIWKTRARKSKSQFDVSRPDCSLTGAIFAQRNGFAILKSVTNGSPILFSYYKYGFKGYDNFCTGYSFMGHLDHEGCEPFRPTFIERIPQTAANVLTTARETGYWPRADVPRYVAEILGFEDELTQTTARWIS